jgi:isochorismate synthase EntC
VTALAQADRWLDARATARLERRVEAALRRARATGVTALVSVTCDVDPACDPTALVSAARRPGEPWFVLEQPDRDGSAIAALGAVRTLEASGPDRFADVARRGRALSAAAYADPPDGPAGAGLTALGGFSFAPDGAAAPEWEGFAPASLVVPELSLARRGRHVALTVNVDVAPDDTAADVLARVERRLGELRPGTALPLLDPDPAGAYKVNSPMAPAHFEEAVARAVQRIRGGELQKVVLAREVEVRAPVDHDSAPILGLLREAFPSCYVFAVGRGDATFLAASPELLIRREGQRASTVALAGSARRSADPAVDDHLGEQLLQSD